jgi:NADH dehydrogenase
VFPLGKAQCRLQPIWVEDLAAMAVNALDNRATFGKTYEVAGPKVYTLRQLVEYAGYTSGHPRLVIGLPDWLAYLQAALMECLPNAPLSRDNLDSLKVDNVTTGPLAPELGVEPVALEAEAPFYLANQTPRERLNRLRNRAGR